MDLTPLPWYSILKGRHVYNESPEQETEWVREAFVMGMILGSLLTVLIGLTLVAT